VLCRQVVARDYRLLYTVRSNSANGDALINVHYTVYGRGNAALSSFTAPPNVTAGAGFDVTVQLVDAEGLPVYATRADNTRVRTRNVRLGAASGADCAVSYTRAGFAVAACSTQRRYGGPTLVSVEMDGEPVRHNASEGLIVQAACPEGYALVDGECRCEAGFQLDLTGACSPCGLGNYRTLGMASCRACERVLPGSTTDTTTASRCLCPPATYLSHARGRCVACPAGADCGGRVGLTALPFTVRDGYWRAFNESEVLEACPVAEACVRGACEAGAGGVLCSVCTSGYYKLSTGRCAPCQSRLAAVSATVVAIVLALLLLVGVAAAGLAVRAIYTGREPLDEANVLIQRLRHEVARKLGRASQAVATAEQGPTAVTRLVHWLDQNATRFKILLVFFQILTLVQVR
jgi:hypothetical protein